MMTNQFKAVFSAVFALLATAGCMSGAVETAAGDSVADDETSLEDAREKSRSDVDEAACRAGGGEVRQAGLLGLFQCITPYSDAGAICRDRADCQGRCMGTDDVTDYDAAPGEAVGRCEADDSPFGCYATIDDGVPGPFICVD